MMMSYLFETPTWTLEESRRAVRSLPRSAKVISAAEPQPITQGQQVSATRDYYREQTLHELAGLQPRPRYVAENHAQQFSRNGKLILTGEAWDLQVQGRRVAECRLVRICGSGTDIVNTWIFPENCMVLPVFAAELLEFGHTPRLVFIDIQAPGWSSTRKAELAERMSDLRQVHGLLPETDPPPTWATDAGVGRHCHSRPGSEAYRDLIREIYNLYLSMWVQIAQESPLADQPSQEIRETLAVYQRHHMESSPGNKYLGKLFGEEWTHSFFTSFLYA